MNSKKSQYAFSVQNKGFLQNTQEKQVLEIKRQNNKKIGRPKKDYNIKILQVNIGLTKKQIDSLKEENDKLAFPFPVLSQYIVAKMKQAKIITD